MYKLHYINKYYAAPAPEKEIPVEKIMKKVKVKKEVVVKDEPESDDGHIDSSEIAVPGGESCDMEGEDKEFQLKFGHQGYCIVYVEGQRVESEDGVQFGAGVWFGDNNSL
jgi:hypothetical protein